MKDRGKRLSKAEQAAEKEAKREQARVDRIAKQRKMHEDAARLRKISALRSDIEMGRLMLVKRRLDLQHGFQVAMGTSKMHEFWKHRQKEERYMDILGRNIRELEIELDKLNK